MPNTLAHLGAQTLVTRTLVRRADVKWIFTGALIPDIPWIAGRAVGVVSPGLRDHDMWAYLIAQSSLVVSLLLCAALALLATAPLRIFVVLSLNALLHLVFDALQFKWGNGVHLLAPIRWSHWNAGWFAIESWPTYALTALGLVVAIWAVRQAEDWDISRLGPVRSISIAGLSVLYLTIPIPLRHGAMRADTSSVGTLADYEHRAGRQVQFDRVGYGIGPDRHFLRTYAGERLVLESPVLAEPATVSARATFVNDSTLAVQAIHEHDEWPRDFVNYVGLAFVASVWMSALMRRRSAWTGGEE